MILNQGTADGHRILSPESVRRMTTNHLTASQRAIGQLFLEGQGWSFGGAVDVEAIAVLACAALMTGGCGASRPSAAARPMANLDCLKTWSGIEQSASQQR
jgi:hypothetical protein